MENYNTIEKSWIASFESSDKVRILKTIYEVRNSGSVKMLPVMLGLINNRTDTEVNLEIIRLVSEMKSPEAVPVLARSFHDNDFGDYQNDLVAACWQSGLDFSNHLNTFVELFVKGDFSTALESFTVIEESLVNATVDQIHSCIHFIKDSESKVSEDKMPLFRELKKVIESY